MAMRLQFLSAGVTGAQLMRGGREACRLAKLFPRVWGGVAHSFLNLGVWGRSPSVSATEESL
jgi:hypothetical protein